MAFFWCCSPLLLVQTAPSFSWDGSRYMGPNQRSREENKWAVAEQKREGEKVSERGEERGRWVEWRGKMAEVVDGK